MKTEYNIEQYIRELHQVFSIHEGGTLTVSFPLLHFYYHLENIKVLRCVYSLKIVCLKKWCVFIIAWNTRMLSPTISN